MPDLFDYSAPQYPVAPGYKATDTSQEAAADIAPTAKTLRAVVYKWILRAGYEGLTTNELVEIMKVSRDSVQPRTSELRAEAKIVDSGKRRLNANGKKAIVWTAK